MTSYRRLRVPGGTYFFTVCAVGEGSTILTDHVDLLRRAWSDTCRDKPFRTIAAVVLPDHLHAIWTLPAGDSDFSNRWGMLKARFTRRYRARMGYAPIPRSMSKARKAEAGVWQRRFWEHHIRDAADLRAHREYCWADPVRHGLVAQPADWALSSLQREVRAGRIGADWRPASLEGPGRMGEPPILRDSHHLSG
ncbi:REP-associated tyrosine transposase [Pelagovum pacificum]|uniref:REP-associated tyrosine transposase n=1 Tax=Pelagovum pacificum TaxID=2588711 RepID=UPI0038CD7258